jgi:pantetheine-phosphate adenylyltransferase
MKTVAIFPGSFNPFHEGHREVVEKALQVFDRVIVAKGVNPAKYNTNQIWDVKIPIKAEFVEFHGLLVTFAERMGATAIVKGLRNGMDLEYEAAQQQWNKELGLTVPTFYIITDPMHRHISSSALRALNKFKKGKS